MGERKKDRKARRGGKERKRETVPERERYNERQGWEREREKI